MSNGADNFYKSDKVTVEKVTFKNQYGMKVAATVHPERPRPQIQESRHHRRPPMGAVKEQSANLYATKMAEQGFVTLVAGLVVLGRKRGRAAPCRFTRYLRRRLQCCRGFSRHPPDWLTVSDRRDRYLRQWQLRHQCGQDRSAPQGHRYRQHVRHGCGQSQWPQAQRHG